ncbi:MAG: transcriptional repressor LexA [Lachnospiraceae bacterium]|nr:transcriptional repressor LexA [Lachnospiraceae bacterium]
MIMGAKKSVTPGIKQQEILDYIKSFIMERGFPPSVREICEGVNLSSTSTVHSHLSALEEKGYIRRDGSKSRTIELVDDDFNSMRKEISNIPIVGTVTAGSPILAVENLEGYFPIPIEYLPNSKTFMLKVKGQSMINKGIFDGDRILVKQQNDARNGEMVVALVGDSVTVKTFYKEKDHIRLQPENDAMDPIIVDDCEILGIVIGLFRLY